MEKPTSTPPGHPLHRVLLPTKRHYCLNELHRFSDASEEAYAAVVYLRTVYDTGPPIVSLLIAKTMVAAPKRQSISWLELFGAQLLAMLLTNVRSALSIDLDHTHAWSDSTFVLHLLDGTPNISRLLLPARTWKHILTSTNPANCASRGLLSNDLISHSLRWNSLPWLLTEPPPVSSSTIVLSNTHHIAVCNTATQTSHDWIEDRHHSFSSLCRITAWVLILIFSLRARKKGTECLLTSSLTTNEI